MKVVTKKQLAELSNELLLSEAEFRGAAAILEEFPSVPLLLEQQERAERRYYDALVRFQEATPSLGARA